MKNLFIQQHKKVNSRNKKYFMQLKKIDNTLKKILCSDDKNIQRGSIINAALAKKVTCDAILLYQF